MIINCNDLHNHESCMLPQIIIIILINLVYKCSVVVFANFGEGTTYSTIRDVLFIS